jgi:glycosyltransferase involved in cell wall biosynthesis
LSESLRQLAKRSGVGNKVIFLGYVAPDEQPALMQQAWLGLNLLENKGLSYYYSLANKYFLYVQAAVPSLNMRFPEYAALNAEFEVSVLLDTLTPEVVAETVVRLLNDRDLYEKLRNNCLLAREVWNWEQEEKTLLGIWHKAFE